MAAPAGPQGAGIALRSATEDNGPEADFFVAIASPSVPPPLEGWTKGANRPESLHHVRTNIPRTAVKGLLPSCVSVSKADILKEVTSKDNDSKLNTSKEGTSGWRYAAVVTPGVLGSLQRGRDDDVHSSGVAGNKGDSPNLKTTRGEGVGGGSERPCPTSSKTRLSDLDATEQEEEPLLHSVHGAVHGTVRGAVHGAVHGTVCGTVHGTVGERRQTYFGSDEVLLAAKSLQAAEHSSRRPKKANVRRLVQHLEARLKLKGRTRTIVAPPSGKTRRYPKQLTKRG